MLLFGEGSADSVVSDATVAEKLGELLEQLGDVRRVVLVPPDITRLDSWAGPITCMLHDALCDHADVWVMPAVGTHREMHADEKRKMFPCVAPERIVYHDCEQTIELLGEIPADFVAELSEGRIRESIPFGVDKLILESDVDHVISIGQVVPHEVVGLANGNKNIMIGLGAKPFIDRSHYLGALDGIERTMGRLDTPVRRLLNRAEQLAAPRLRPISYIQTVRGPDERHQLVTRGLFGGQGDAPFVAAAKLSAEVNIHHLEEPARKVVAYLNPEKYESLWIGNKAIYRSRMALADGGTLIVLAPGLRRLGENDRQSRLIHQYTYLPTEEVVRLVEAHAELRENLGVPAHLIHGSSEGRFRIVYATPAAMKDQIEAVGYEHADIDEMLSRYAPHRLVQGPQDVDGEEIFYIPDPGLGLWKATRDE